jgi:hypothetical protein
VGEAVAEVKSTACLVFLDCLLKARATDGQCHFWNPRKILCVDMLLMSNCFSAEQLNKYDNQINLCALMVGAAFNLE